MPQFVFAAYNAQGKKVKGTIDAIKSKEALDQLKDRGLVVSNLTLKGGKRIRFTPDTLMTFTTQMAQLAQSKIPLYEALVIIEQQSRGEAYHPIVLNITEEIKRGVQLSTALSRYPESFSPLYIALVKAGEAVGKIDHSMISLGTLLQKTQKLKRELSGALIYPLILSIFSMLVIGMLLGFVVPSIEGMFEGKELNAFTGFVIGISHFVKDDFYWWLPSLVGIISYFVYRFKSIEGKMQIERQMLHIPLLKKVVILQSMARFLRTMATLQQGGLNLVESLEHAKKVMNNHVLEKVITQCEKKIHEGSFLSKELARSPYIPPIIIRMLKIAEETGDTKSMFEKLADLFEGDLEKILSRVVALAQPVILILMGGVIGLVMLAVLLPLTQMAQL